MNEQIQIIIEEVKKDITCPYCNQNNIRKYSKFCPNCQAKISYKKEDLFIKSRFANFLSIFIFTVSGVASILIGIKSGWLWSVPVLLAGMWIDGIIINFMKGKKLDYTRKEKIIFHNPCVVDLE